VKTYGIYLAYPPEVDLRAEGLGRFLGEFLKEAANRADARFVIACPSWTRKSLDELFERAGIPPAAFEIIGPERKPKLLEFYQLYVRYRRKRRRKGRLLWLVRRLKGASLRNVARAENFVVTTRSGLLLAVLALLALPFLAAGVATMATLNFF
jgi:hypothetical protein